MVYSSLKISPRVLQFHPLEYANYTKVLDAQWNVRIPHLNLTAHTNLSKTLGEVKTVLASTQAHSRHTASFTSIMEIWFKQCGT